MHQKLNIISTKNTNYIQENTNNNKQNNKKEDITNNKNILLAETHNTNNIKKDLYTLKDINLNMNINKEIDQNDKANKIQSSSHEITNSCINECIIWTLKAQINMGKSKTDTIQKEFKYNYTFQGQNIFFPKLEFSILNAFNNALCFEKCFMNSNKMNFDNKKKIFIKLKQESNKQIKDIDLKNNIYNNSDNANMKDFLENIFPLNNNKNNFNIIDNNLCLKENLSNIFLLKFDLMNDLNKNNDFRLINDNCVEREISFMLNGEMHGNKIFKNDLKFWVTYREFIKTIQFRLDTFKKKILDYNYNRKYYENNNKNHNNLIQEQNRKIFYGKLINNVNIGIEFLKPQNFEQLQTNFNSIVNSEIELTRIFIELTIPKNLISTNISNNENVEAFNPKKEEEKNKNMNIKEPKSYIPTPPLLPSSYIPPPPAPPASWANLNFFNMRLGNDGIPLPPPFPNLLLKKDFSKDSSNSLYKNKYPNVTFDYLSINHNDHKSPLLSIDPINIYSSPTSGNYSPMSASYLMMQPMPYFGGMMRNQSMSMNSPFNSNYSSPYISKNINLNFSHSNSNTRKYSDTYNKELIENLMPSKLNLNIDDTSLLNLQQSLSPRSIEKQQNSFNETDISSNGNIHNHDYYRKIVPNTIKQRIIESKKKSNKENKDKTKDINDNNQNNKNVFRELRDSFILANQEKTNLEIFLESVSPLYKKNIDFPFLKFKLIDIFEKFRKVSLFGLKNIYCFNGELIHLSYLLTLSSISIKIISKTLIENIVLELKKKHSILEKYNQLKPGEELTINIYQFIIYFSSEYIQISFSENKPYQLRNPFIKTINELAKNFPYFNEITIEDINLIDSLFSILYSPLKCSKPFINYTSFVVYYQFTKEVIEEDKINKDYLKYDKQTITGVLPIKINTNLYFQRIIIFNFVMNISPLFNYFSPYFNNDTIMIKNMTYAVINDVSKHIRGTSYDYECFMKLSKHNTINQWR